MFGKTKMIGHITQLPDKDFWELFFKTEHAAEKLSDVAMERIVIEMKHQSGEKVKLEGVRLKPSVKKV